MPRSCSAPHGVGQPGQLEGCSLGFGIDRGRREPHRAARQSSEIVKGGFRGLKDYLSGGLVCVTGDVSASEWL